MRRFVMHPYVLALLWGSALVLSSWLLRGRAAGDWVDAALYVGAGAWLATTWLARGHHPRR